MSDSTNIIARITARTNRVFVPSYTGLVRGIATSLGFSREEASRLELVTEEACLNVIEHAYENDAFSYFTITVETGSGQFLIGIEDKGVPYDWERAERGEGVGAGLKIIQGCVDQVRYSNLGKEGKRIELIKNLPGDYPDAALMAIESSPRQEARNVEDVSLSLRLLRPDEGVGLARCFYHCYGYSYFDFVYHPQKMRELIEGGLQVSIVAVTPDDEIVGHFAMTKEASASLVAETGQAVVNPRFRGRHLFESMKKKAAELAREQGIRGLYSESVTIHPYTQKGNLSLGATETGILLDYVPQQITFKSIDRQVSQRQTTVLFYLRTNEEPQREVYPPVQHREMIEKIYRHGSFRRVLKDSPLRDIAELPAESRIEVKTHPELLIAFIRAHACGRDLTAFVKAHLRQMCINKYDCIHLDLPLCDPGTPLMAAAMERAGFSFAGVIPEFSDGGDMLRFQYLNNLSVEARDSVLVSELCRELYRYVLRCYDEAHGI